MEKDIPLTSALFFAKNTDLQHGGMKGSPKFPMPAFYNLILGIYYRTQSPELLKALESTLDGMATGGIFDHLGGGSLTSPDELKKRLLKITNLNHSIFFRGADA